MDKDQEMLKRIYDETAGLIMSWLTQQRINIEEMQFLLSLLDEVMVTRNYPQLTDKLDIWLKHEPDASMDEIITATLLAVDFKQPDEVKNLLSLLDNFSLD